MRHGAAPKGANHAFVERDLPVRLCRLCPMDGTVLTQFVLARDIRVLAMAGASQDTNQRAALSARLEYLLRCPNALHRGLHSVLWMVSLQRCTSLAQVALF